MLAIDRARRYRLSGLVLVAFLIGAMASPSASARPDEVATVAQTSPTATQPNVDQFGGYIASARANGLQISYDSPGLLPIGSPIVELSVPESLATLNSGPVGYGLASFVFPGPLLGDLGAALAAGGTETGLPPYPVRAEAFFPAGPTEAITGDGGTSMGAETTFADTKAYSSYAGVALDPLAEIGLIKADTRSNIEGAQLYARATSEIGNISILAGLINIESVRTELIATSNGNKAASSGQTVVTGATVLGIPVTIDANGINFTPPAVPEGSPTTPPTTSALGGVLAGTGLDGLINPDEILAPVIQPLNALLTQVGAAGDDALQQLFDASGIEIKVLGTTEVIDGSSANRTAAGLSITINYDGGNTPVLTDLLELIPTDLLPADNLGPVPFSPQALVNLLKKVHIAGITLAPANVSATATPAFEIDIPPFVAPPAIAPSLPVSAPSATPSVTPQPLASPVEADDEVAAPVTVSSRRGFPYGQAIPALLIIAALLGSPFFAGATMKLADNTLADEVLSCPEGRDRPRI